MRKRRQLKQNAAYHVTARINRGEMVFNEIAMRILFLAYIKRVKKKHSFAIYNFCIMGNHVHFVIRPDKDSSLSKIMQWLLGNYAKAWNKAHGVKGHLWGDRFHSVIISDRRGFLKVFTYVSNNPVEAGLVVNARDWEAGGVCHFERGEMGILDIPPWLKAIYQTFIGLE
jgi:REP element-mobilizing transposase RayT